MDDVAGCLEEQIRAGRSAERAGDWSTALARFEAAFSRVGREGSPAQAAELLRWIGTIHRERGDLEVATELYEASLAIAQLNELPEPTAGALICLGAVAQYRGELEVAKGHYLEARGIAQALSDPRLRAMIDQNLGTVFNIQGDLRSALTRYEVALHTYQKLKETALGVRCLNNLGMIHIDLGEWLAAARCLDNAANLADELQDAEMQGIVALNRAELHLKLREYEQARSCCDRALEVFTRLGALDGQAEAHKFLAVLHRKTDRPQLAEAHFPLAVELARKCENRLLEAEAEYQHAQLHLDAGRNPEALRCLNRAHQLFTGLQARRDILDVDQRLDRLEESFLEVVRAWGDSIESKDAFTAGHCQRVADYACLLAESAGITGRELTWFRMGAYLHDLGKAEVPPELLNKAGSLTPEEWELMRSHTVVGDEMLDRLDFPWDIRPIIRSHHEHWDGTGYPDGLRGEEIPLPARILCIADVFDALTTTRSYRPAHTREEALRIMEELAGRTLDPRLFELFREVITRPPGTPEPPGEAPPDQELPRAIA